MIANIEVARGEKELIIDNDKGCKMIKGIIESYREDNFDVDLIYEKYKIDVGGYSPGNIKLSGVYADKLVFSDLFKNNKILLMDIGDGFQWNTSLNINKPDDFCSDIENDIRNIPNIPQDVLNTQRYQTGWFLREFIIWLRDISFDKIQNLPLSSFTFSQFSGSGRHRGIITIYDTPFSESMKNHIIYDSEHKLHMIYTLDDNAGINIRYRDEKEGAYFSNYWSKGKHVPTSFELYNQNLKKGERI